MEISNQLLLKQMQIGPMENFIYFLGDARSNEIAVVDPAWDVDLICRTAEENGLKITAVFLTHGHPDHVNGLDELLLRHDVPAYISCHEAPFYKPQHTSIVEVEDRQTLNVGAVEFECLWTPGHTPGGQCFKHGNNLVTGDVLFIDGCGRCDLPGGDAGVMYDTLYDIIMKLPDDTIIYPGHDYGPTPFATLQSQKKTNPYLTCRNKDEFLRQRMGMVL